MTKGKGRETEFWISELKEDYNFSQALNSRTVIQQDIGQWLFKLLI